MSERSIILRPWEARAFAEGRKTQIMRAIPDAAGRTFRGWCVSSTDRADEGKAVFAHNDGPLGSKVHHVRCPFGQPGAVLWGRETWRVCGGREYEYQQDRSQVMYRATHQEDGFPLTWESYGWRASITMPRWAARTVRRVAAVRVMRVQEISEADAVAHGFETVCMRPSGDDSGTAIHGPHGFREQFDADNGPGAWDKNLWVFVADLEEVR